MGPCTAAGTLSCFHLFLPQHGFFRMVFEKHYSQNLFPAGALETGMPRVLTCHKIAEAHRGEGNHHKVNGLQGGPALDISENDSGDRHKYNAASQDEQDG